MQACELGQSIIRTFYVTRGATKEDIVFRVEARSYDEIPQREDERTRAGVGREPRPRFEASARLALSQGKR